MKKIAFALIWLAIVILGPITVLRIFPLSYALQFKVNTADFIWRLTTLMAFSMLFIHLVITSNKQWFAKKLGDWILKFTSFDIWVIYLLIFLQMLSWMLYNYFFGLGLDPFYVFTQVCVLCGKPVEYYYTLGRVSFWLVVTIVVTILFNTITPFLRRNWKKFENLNYIIFILLGIEGYFVVSGFRLMPFLAFAVPAYLIVLYIVFFKKLPELVNYIRTWLA